MSRIRSIKPDFFASVKVCSVSIEARYLFVGLLTESDDEGRQLAAPRRITGALFPHDDTVNTSDVRRWLDELEAAKLIERYEGDDGAQYLYICGFAEHQRVSKPTASKLPAPPPRTSAEIAESPREPAEAPESPREPAEPAGDSALEVEVEVEREVEVIASAKPPRNSARAPDELWDAVMEVCSIDPNSITPSARGAYNRALKDLRSAGAEPAEVPQRAIVYRLKWPDTTLTPPALARHWAELQPNGHGLPGRVVPKGTAALLRVAGRDA